MVDLRLLLRIGRYRTLLQVDSICCGESTDVVYMLL